MGASYSVEPSEEALSTAKKFISTSLHHTHNCAFTNVRDVIEAAARMYPEIEKDDLEGALLTSFDSNYIRFRMVDEEFIPDVILNHRLLDVAEIEPIRRSVSLS